MTSQIERAGLGAPTEESLGLDPERHFPGNLVLGPGCVRACSIHRILEGCQGAVPVGVVIDWGRWWHLNSTGVLWQRPGPPEHFVRCWCAVIGLWKGLKL